MGSAERDEYLEGRGLAETILWRWGMAMASFGVGSKAIGGDRGRAVSNGGGDGEAARTASAHMAV